MPTTGTQLNVMIDAEKRDAFKNKVRGQGKTVNEVINALIDQYLLSEDFSNLPNQDNLDEKIDKVIEKRLESLFKQPNPDNLITHEDIEKAIATSLKPITDQLTALSNRLRDIESSPVEDVTLPVVTQPESEEITDGTLPLIFDEPTNGLVAESEPEGVTASSLAPIFNEPENEPITKDTPLNDDSPIEEKLDGLLGEIEGQSKNTTKAYTLTREEIAKGLNTVGMNRSKPQFEMNSKGIGNQALSDLLSVPKSTVEKWKTSLKKGETVKPRKYPNFMSEWRLGDDSLWYLID
jgi:hypothetical protein